MKDMNEYTKFPDIITYNTDAIDAVLSNDAMVYYPYQNIMVPRVSKILDVAIGKRALVDWAARVGYRKMTDIRDTALTVGSIVHEMIEHNLKTNLNKNVNFSDYDMSQKAINQAITAYENFKVWKTDMINNHNTIDIIGTEVTVACPWYGGTVDCIAKINGCNYIIDFKTSKQISIEYLLQVCSYAWMVNGGYCDICDHIDGVGILRFDKIGYNNYDEYFLNYFVPEQSEQIYQYTQTFWAVLNSFYNLVYSGQILKNTLRDPAYEIDNIEVNHNE